jgi:hypothetical protein
MKRFTKSAAIAALDWSLLLLAFPFIILFGIACGGLLALSWANRMLEKLEKS